MSLTFSGVFKTEVDELIIRDDSAQVKGQTLKVYDGSGKEEFDSSVDQTFRGEEYEAIKSTPLVATIQGFPINCTLEELLKFYSVTMLATVPDYAQLELQPDLLDKISSIRAQLNAAANGGLQ